MLKSRIKKIRILIVILLVLIVAFLANLVYVFIDIWPTVEYMYIDYKNGDKCTNPFLMLIVCFIVVLSAVIGLFDVIPLIKLTKYKYISREDYRFLKTDKIICIISSLLSFAMLYITVMLLLKSIMLHFLCKQLSFANNERNQENT